MQATPASAQSSGIAFHFPQPPIASAGSIGPNGSVNFVLRVTNNGAKDPGYTVYLCECDEQPGRTDGYASGDSTTVPAAQCFGVSQLPSDGSQIPCTTDANGLVNLTYHVPAQPPAQGRADWLASDNPTHATIHVVDHYVYTTVYRFGPSPIAPSGSLGPSAIVPVTLTAENGRDQGVANSVVYLSFLQATGGGSASVGLTALTATPTAFTLGSNGALQLNYTAPSTSPGVGQDSIVAQDAPSSPTGVNSDSYAFAAAAPSLSVGNVNVVEGDQPAATGPPSTPADFTVTISPPQAQKMTVQYVTICGFGDKGCGEDFSQRANPITVTIPAKATSTKINVPQFAYVGGLTGEPYSEGWYVELENPQLAGVAYGVVGRSVGEGVLLPDIEGSLQPLPDLYAGDAGLVPTMDTAGETLYFTVTLASQENSTVTFNYATVDGSAVATKDYVATSGTATILPGFTSFVIPVTVRPNAPPTTSLTFSLTISGASSGLTIARATGIGTILAS
jgi:Calx-beta domain